MIPAIELIRAGALTWHGFRSHLDVIALHWFQWTLFVVALRVAYLIWKHNVWLSLIWFVKLVTDPVTDIIAYFPRPRSLRA